MQTREVHKTVKNINRIRQSRLTAITDDNGNVLINNLDFVQRWTRYCGGLYKTQMDQDVVKQVIEELKELSSPAT
jgi:hypothetical protein